LESIGIGITTKDRNAQVLDTIERIKQFTNVPYKLVVVDDGSKIPVPHATFRFDVNQGSPIAKNKCLELLEGCDHIFLFDDDTYPIKSGWEQLYIKSGAAHLNYTFKYKFKLVNGLLHFENPNGCMIYLTKEVLQKVGGFDTGFIKYGYWHGAFSNRVFNAGLIPHPFMDVMGSGRHLYCMDQNPKENRTSTPDRGKYLAQNKRRYFEKLDSKEFIPYKKDERIRVFYSNPYSTEKNIGKALNEFCELVPDGSWICLQDGDIAYLTPNWGRQIEDAIRKHGDEFGLIGCVTNRLGRDIQRVGDMNEYHDMLRHAEIGRQKEKENWAEVEDITDKKYIAGMFMLFPKSVWNECKFEENNIAFDDAFSKSVRRKGYKLGLMKGLYVYHLYRIWSENPSKDRQHLK
jgi:glycosyltransferase involved in cell wall biosynthesis